MSRSLPLRANLEWLRKLSKERLAELRVDNPGTTLSMAQLAVAREFGFPSWRQLKAQVDHVREQLDALIPPELRRRAATETIAADDPEVGQFLTAIIEGQTQTVAEMLARRPALGAVTGTDGQSPLHLAARYNDPRIATLLVAYGADVETTFGESSHTPLSWAVTCNAPDCARQLLKLGAEPDLFCAAGIGALEHVREYFDAAGTLIAGASQTGSSRFASDGSRLPSPPTSPREQISDALYIACRNGQADIVRELLTRDPDLSFRAFLGGTALHWAHFGGSQAVIDLLLEHGADATARDTTLGCTPRGFGICVPANWGLSFLVRARLTADPSLVNLPDEPTSPLHEAAKHNRTEVAQLLLTHGANPLLPNAAGQTALDLALEGGHAALAELLRGGLSSGA